MLNKCNKHIKDDHEPVGLWKGYNVGPEAKGLLQAVERRYPETFRIFPISSKDYWLSILKGFHGFIKGFLETPVEAVGEQEIASIEADLKEFETFKFDLSWARKRLDMVKSIKFGKERLELEVLEESLKCTYKTFVEANERLEKAKFDYDDAANALNKKLCDLENKYGAEYYGLLNGKLGLGMLPE